MNILYIGDIMAAPGCRAVARALPQLRNEYQIDFVIAQVENSDPNGKGPGKQEIQTLQSLGVDFFSGGNHSLTGSHSLELYSDSSTPVIRPANFINAAGSGYKVVDTRFGKILIVSILGLTVGKLLEISNPLQKIDEILKETKDEVIVARVVNFHGDYSSEKRVFGYYVDGRLSAVIGDHWHVPTADAMILPGATAHITDVGMCGTLHSSLGVKTQVIIDRWKTGRASKNQIETDGLLQFNAALVDIDTSTGLSRSIEHIQRIIAQDD